MKIAVVILNWNGVKLLEQFLPSVVKYSPEATIYVADNASTDASVAFIKTNFPDIKVIQNTENFGFAGGYNTALKAIDTEIYALVNSDIEVTQNWLVPIIQNFKHEAQTGIIQPKIKDYKNKDYFEYAGGAGGFIDQFGYPYCRGRIFETVEKDTQQYDDNREIFWASGACFFIRSVIYKELAGFDESFFAHQEEIDLCWRAYNKGYKIKYNSESVVYHVGGATLKLENPKKTFLNFRNSLFMLTKNLPDKKLFPILFGRLVLDAVAGVQFLLQGKFSHFYAIIKAHFFFYRSFSVTYKKRTNYQSKHYYYCKSIVFLYYLKRVKLFKNILTFNKY